MPPGRARAAALLFALASACAGDVPARARGDGGPGVTPPPGPDAGPGGPPTDECGDVRRAARVYYGTEQPTYVPLSAGQILAVGTFGGCSGALVAPTWVLTAAHCGLSGGTEFCMGTDPGDADVCLGAARAIDNPDGDMTLVELDEDARARLPQVVPIPIVTEDLGPAWIGRTAEAAGYGQTESGGYGTRRFTAEPIARLGGDVLTIDGQGMRGVCFGDSGGPVMVIAADGTVRVAGDLSNGDGSCVGQDNYTRADVHRAWIEGFTGPTVVDPGGGGGDAGDPCGGLDERGRCDGPVARWCEGGAPRQRDCAACGQACGWVDDVMGFYCR